MKKDKLPPQNLDAERELISAVYLNPEVLDGVIQKTGVEAEDFMLASHQLIWNGTLALRKSGIPITAITLKECLEADGVWDQTGGEDYLCEVLTAAPHELNAEYMAFMVREKAMIRSLIEACTDTLKESYVGGSTFEQLTGAHSKRVESLVSSGIKTTVMDGRQLADAFRARQAARLAGKTGLMTGYGDLDDLLGGLQNGQLVLVAARPSVGKSAGVLNFAVNVAESGHGVFFASVEMGHGEIVDRLASMKSGVIDPRLRSPRLHSAADAAALASAMTRLETTPLWIDDSSSQTVTRIHATAARLKRAGNLKMVVVDYAQILEPEDNVRGSRNDQVAEVSKRLKQMARSLNVPVVVCCSMSRGPENREDKRPRMGDLRESGQLESDADAVILLFREGYYDPAKDDGTLDLIIAKNRNGSTGTASLLYDRARSLLTNIVPGLAPLGPGTYQTNGEAAYTEQPY